MNVLALDAGGWPRWSQARFLFHAARRKFGYRIEKDARALARHPIQSQCYAWPYSPRSFVDDHDNPYTTPAGKPFTWIRSHQVGGRLAVPLHGLQFYRLSDHDFKAASRDGFGVDWPLSYAELAPFYDRVERWMGLVGNADDIPHLPNPIPGVCIEMTPGEERLRSKIAERWPDRKLIKRRTAAAPMPILAALATGRLTLRTRAVAREILVDRNTGRARGVSWLEGGHEREASARVVILAASAIESARLLLNSKSPQHPEGLANSSGTLGCYLMDHTSILGFAATMPLAASEEHNGTSWTYVPQFRNVTDKRSDFLRGYGVSIYTRGKDCLLTIFGEMLPRASNRVTIDPVRKDKWGIPVARIHCEHSDNERAMAQDAITECRELLTTAGFSLKPGGAQARHSRPRHSRSRNRAHGKRSEDLSARPLQSRLGREEPLRRGRRLFCLARSSKSHTDDDGVGAARLRPHHRFVPTRRTLIRFVSEPSKARRPDCQLRVAACSTYYVNLLYAG